MNDNVFRAEQASVDMPKPPRMLPILGFVLALCFLAMLFQAYKHNDNAPPEGALVGKSAPLFDLQRLEPELRGQRLVLASVIAEGRPVVINLWASWCIACIDEAEDLERFWRNNRSRVSMIGIALQDKPADAYAFASEHQQTYPLAFDEEGTLGIDYGIMGVPETFVIDAEGIVRHRFVGAVTTRQLEQAIRGLPISGGDA